MYKFLILLFFSFTFCSQGLYAEEKVKFELKDYKKDILYLFSVLESAHPDISHNIGYTEYERRKKEFFNSVTLDTTPKEFLLSAEKFVAGFKDAHTRIRWWWKPAISNTGKILRSGLRIVDGRFIYLMCNKRKKCRVYNVSSINNLPVKEFVENAKTYFSHENNVYGFSLIRECLENLDCARLHFGVENDFLSIGLGKKNATIKLHYIGKGKNVMDDEIRSQFIDCKFFCYQHLHDKSTTYLRLNKMADRSVVAMWFSTGRIKDEKFKLEDVPFFGVEMKKMFDEMNANNNKNLIVDLRNNGGGNSIIGKQLVFLSTNQPYIKGFKVDCKNSKFLNTKGLHCGQGNNNSSDYLAGLNSMWAKRSGVFLGKRRLWHGDIYVLVGEKTFSSAAELATVIKDNNLGVIVGQPTGGSATSFGDVLDFELPQTHIRGTVSYKYFIRPNGNESIESLKPDWQISMRDYARYNWSQDAEILYVIDKIN